MAYYPLTITRKRSKLHKNSEAFASDFKESIFLDTGCSYCITTNDSINITHKSDVYESVQINYIILN